jgi:ABC-type bacteriocin/lantibiotic exporter with double-glycine peptidase domain
VTRSKPPFRKQETRYSCAPACLRMVLGGLGVELDEARLRALTDCTQLGTEAFQLVEAARRLGFSASRKYTLASVDELSRLLEEGLFPIVYVDLWPLRGGRSGQFHSLVVVGVEPDGVVVLDPLSGESRLARDDFEAAWAEMRYLTIVVAGR